MGFGYRGPELMPDLLDSSNVHTLAVGDFPVLKKPLLLLPYDPSDLPIIQLPVLRPPYHEA